MLISLREFARRNGVDVAAISRAVKAGRIPNVNGKIDFEQAQPVWDSVKDRGQVGRKLKRSAVDPVAVNTPIAVDPARVNTGASVDPAPVNGVDRIAVNSSGGRSARVAVTVPLNGAEEMRLAKDAANLGITLQAFVLSRCGLEMWRLGVPARPIQRREVRNALERRSVTVLLAADGEAVLRAEARAAGLSLPQYIRARCSFPVRHTSMPGTAERDREEDQAWELLRGIGLDPGGYFDD